MVRQNADDSGTIEAARSHVGEELVDCLACILKLSNHVGIDPQEARLQKKRRNLTLKRRRRPK